MAIVVARMMCMDRSPLNKMLVVWVRGAPLQRAFTLYNNLIFCQEIFIRNVFDYDFVIFLELLWEWAVKNPTWEWAARQPLIHPHP